MKLMQNGVYVGTFPDEVALAVFAEENDIDLNAHAYSIELTPQQIRLRVRADIEANVGDEKSLIGTQADVMGLLVAGQMARVVALADHANNAAQRQELAVLQSLAGDADLVQLCRDGLAAIQGGDVVLTAAVKGVGKVFSEAFARSTATAAILAGISGE